MQSLECENRLTPFSCWTLHMATKPGFIFCRIVKELPKIDCLIFFSFFVFYCSVVEVFHSAVCISRLKAVGGLFAAGQFSPLICRTMPRSHALLCIACTCTHCCLAISHGHVLRKWNGCSGSVAVSINVIAERLANIISVWAWFHSCACLPDTGCPKPSCLPLCTAYLPSLESFVCIKVLLPAYVTAVNETYYGR